MKIITKYILQQMLFGFMLMTTGLLMIVWLSQSLRLFDVLLNSKVSIWLFIQMTITLIPGYLAIISPIALFAVSLFTYNRLIADRELIILRAAGMSNLQLAKPIIVTGCIFLVFGFYISLILVPNAVTNFRELRWKIQNDVSHLLIQEGEFNDVGSDITVYIKSKSSDGKLEGILLHDKHSAKTQVTLLAEEGSIAYNNGAPMISMKNGSRQEISKETGRFSILYFDKYNLDFLSQSEKKAQRHKNPRERSLTELLTIPRSELVTDKVFHKFRMEAYRRLTLPFYNLSFMLIAVAGLLTGTFNRRGHSKRIIGTILVMATVQLSSLGAENLCMKSLNFIPLLFVVAIAPIFVSIYVLKRSNTLTFSLTGFISVISASKQKMSSFVKKILKKGSFKKV